MAISDMNADGKDDIVRYNLGRVLNIEFQEGPNQTFAHQNYDAISNFSQWSTTIADVDNNGYNDILVGGSYDNIKLIYNENGSSLTGTTIGNSNIFLQGSNFVDIDNDGSVDIFACHDDGDNRKYRNNGSGGFDFLPSLINTKTSPASDNSGNYASAWIDYDNDGDTDMYLSKCRQAVNDPRDPRRVNRLYRRNSNGTFTEVSAQAGMDLGAQTWMTDFGDIDNDGDLDAFIANHYDACQLMRNNGDGTYTDITVGSGFLPFLQGGNDVFAIQASFQDFNNDGFVDLLFSGSHHFLFYNNGDSSFSITDPFGGNAVESFAIGDLNSDGFLDVYAGYAELFTRPVIFLMPYL